MPQERIEGFLSRELTLTLLNGEESKYFLYVLKPIGRDKCNRRLDCDGKLEVYMQGYELLPFSGEQPFIMYIDSPLQLSEISHSRYCLISKRKI